MEDGIIIVSLLIFFSPPFLSSSGVNTLTGSFPKSHSSHGSEFRVTGTPLSVDQSPDSGLVSTPVSDTHTLDKPVITLPSQILLCLLLPSS